MSSARLYAVPAVKYGHLECFVLQHLKSNPQNWSEGARLQASVKPQPLLDLPTKIIMLTQNWKVFPTQMTLYSLPLAPPDDQF